MDNNDHQAIKGLFDKLSHVERQSAPRDEQANAYIQRQISEQPAAPYYMAQTIVVQEQALNAAQARIEELERQATQPQAGGGLLSGLFGSSAKPASRSGGVPRVGQSNAYGAQAQQPSFGGQQQQQPSFNRGAGGDGFLAGAAQTAMGVAGGVLLGNAIAGMFAGDQAQAAEAPTEDTAGEDEMGGFDDGGMDDMDF